MIKLVLSKTLSEAEGTLPKDQAPTIDIQMGRGCDLTPRENDPLLPGWNIALMAKGELPLIRNALLMALLGRLGKSILLNAIISPFRDFPTP
ncbi:MAG: hypothetical protein NTZ78_07245 [Candidatus Aureabacteria bacterium]|nr:hypothetical protein [Candidatus Auribacterota bacterium]